MRNIEAFLAATPLLFACASAPERRQAEQPVVQHVEAPICAKLANAEAVEQGIWPEALGDTVDEVRDACAKVMNDPGFCPDATSIGLSRTAHLNPALLLPSGLAREAQERCLKLLGPRGKCEKCIPSGGGFGLKMTM